MISVSLIAALSIYKDQGQLGLHSEILSQSQPLLRKAQKKKKKPTQTTTTTAKRYQGMTNELAQCMKGVVTPCRSEFNPRNPHGQRREPTQTHTATLVHAHTRQQINAAVMTSCTRPTQDQGSQHSSVAG